MKTSLCLSPGKTTHPLLRWLVALTLMAGCSDVDSGIPDHSGGAHGDGGSSLVDAGEDTGDAAVHSDSAVVSDIGVRADADVLSDAGVAVDASAPNDTGIPSDAGVLSDSSVPGDSGVVGNPDGPPLSDWYAPWPPLHASDWPNQQWVWIPVEGALCANGQTSGFWVNFSNQSDDLLIYLAGGGICYDEISCNATARDGLLNGLGPDPQAWWVNNPESWQGIHDRGNPQNPFRNANFVAIPHCTVDFHSADQISNIVGFPPLHQRGYSNIRRYMNVIGPTFGATAVRDVTIAGFSAGGVGTLSNYHQIAQVFESYGSPPPFLINDGGPVQRPPFFTLASSNKIVSSWNLANTIGQWCPRCTTDGVHNALARIHELHPGVRSSQICAYGDAVAMGLYSLFDPIGNPIQFRPWDGFGRGLRDLNAWAEGLPGPGMHRSLLYHRGDRHGSLVVTHLDEGQTPAIIPFLNAQLNRNDPNWFSYIENCNGPLPCNL